MINNNITIENAKIGFRNFSGAAGKFNPEGNRNFCVFLDEDIAQQLDSDGWAIKTLAPRSEEDNPQPYLKVKVSFDHIPPTIILVTKRGKTRLNDSTINMLDWAEVELIDMVIRPYNWEVGGKTGVTAYIKTMYVTIAEDEFADKYYDTPDSAISCIGDDCEI